MSTLWQQRGEEWWLTDFTAIPDPSRLGRIARYDHWQTAPYESTEFAGVMILANPKARAPEIRIPLPVKGRASISVGVLENYSDRLLIKLGRDRCFEKLRHGEVIARPSIQELWWKDVDLAEGDVLVLKQDAGMEQRCTVTHVRIQPAGPASEGQFPFVAVMDGYPGNNGPLELGDMVGEELQFAGTHVSAICHGTDISGLASYRTELPGHKYPAAEQLARPIPWNQHDLWTLQQLLKGEQSGRCILRDSIEAAHSIQRPFYAYHRMALTRAYAPLRIFENPLFDAHPEWQCVDFDGTPISRMSICFPEVRQFFLDHFRETVALGADGVCLVFCRGWPMVMFEKPIAEEFHRRTGKEMHEVPSTYPSLWHVRADFMNEFMRDIRKVVTDAGKGRDTKVYAITLAQPKINQHFAFDCETWAREGLVDVFCPYPYGYDATPTQIDVLEWARLVKGSKTQLCPIMNRMTYEPAGIIETPQALLARAEQWISEGAHGLSVWDLDHNLSLPTYRQLACHIASKDGRARLRRIFESFPTRYTLKSIDGIAVDRYHPGWNL